MNVLLWCACGFLMFLGVATLWEWLLIGFSRPKYLPLRYEIVPLGGRLENAEQLLRYLALTCGERAMVLVDMGMDEESRELCRRFCWENNNQFLKPEELCASIFPENELEEVENK